MILDGFLMAIALGIIGMSSWLHARFQFFFPLEVITDPSMIAHLDFDVFLHSARALWEGGVVYSEHRGNINATPPVWTVLVAPLALLEPITAYRIFVLITILVTVGYVAWMADELELRLAWTIVGASMLFFSSPFLAELLYGQIYSLLALGLVAAWVADRRGKPTVSGVALGLVLAVKPQFAPRAFVAAGAAKVAQLRRSASLRGSGDVSRGRCCGARGAYRLADLCVEPPA